MSNVTAKLSAIPNGRDTVDALRSKVVQFRSAALPKAASAAESAGEAVSKASEAVSKLALSTSKNVAGALRKQAPSKSAKLATLLPVSALARGAARFAARNPAAIALAGLGIAALGYVAWRRQHADTALSDDDADVAAQPAE